MELDFNLTVKSWLVLCYCQFDRIFFRKVTLFVMKSSNSSKLLFDEKFESIRSFLERSTMSVIVSYDSIVCIFCNQFRALKKLGLRNAFLDPDPRNCWHKKHQKTPFILCSAKEIDFSTPIVFLPKVQRIELR